MNEKGQLHLMTPCLMLGVMLGVMLVFAEDCYRPEPAQRLARFAGIEGRVFCLWFVVSNRRAKVIQFAATKPAYLIKFLQIRLGASLVAKQQKQLALIF